MEKDESDPNFPRKSEAAGLALELFHLESSCVAGELTTCSFDRNHIHTHL